MQPKKNPSFPAILFLAFMALVPFSMSAQAFPLQAFNEGSRSGISGKASYILSEIENDTIRACSSETIRLQAVARPDSSMRFLWSTGDTASFIDITFHGSPETLYWCRHANSSNASSTDSVQLIFLPPYAYLGPDTAFCLPHDSLPAAADTLLILNPSALNADGLSYRWFALQGENPGGTLARDSLLPCTFSMLEEIGNGIYAGGFGVEVSDPNPVPEACQGRDTIWIRVFSNPYPAYDTNLFLPYDTTLCAHADLAFQLPSIFHGYWLDADSIVLPFGSDTNQYVFHGQRGTDGFGAGTDTRQAESYYLAYRHRYCPAWAGMDSLNLVHLVRPQVEIPSDTLICRDIPVEIEAQLPLVHENAYAFSWDDGSREATREFSTGGLFQACFALKDEYNTCGYEAACDTISITWVDPVLTDVPFPTDTVICTDLTLTLDATVPFDSTLYSWEKGSIPELEFEEDSITFTEPVIVIEEEGVYNIRIIDSMGCENRVEVNVTLDECRPLLDIPNVFTPNGDGVNDVLKFNQVEKCTDVRIQIVNRWGRVVLKDEVKNAEDFQWNGCLHNSSRKLPDGPYFYMVTYKDMYGKNKVQSGSITILGSSESRL